MHMGIWLDLFKGTVGVSQIAYDVHINEVPKVGCDASWETGKICCLCFIQSPMETWGFFFSLAWDKQECKLKKIHIYVHIYIYVCVYACVYFPPPLLLNLHFGPKAASGWNPRSWASPTPQEHTGWMAGWPCTPLCMQQSHRAELLCSTHLSCKASCIPPGTPLYQEVLGCCGWGHKDGYFLQPIW